ncbi:type II toxin-antitoxin system VapC family toxin [Desulfonatronum sp. SC1]|uniref:type II toxin-antitoxin system VapC family toxin n=1 Tax=Desulfonatronum sp. SC1 TaxID=2109626 RepID=UPI000D30662C|nr:type II toxin-antitoxin system VapC family toxin [Desulfonatronum sp. SC1]PTN38091.1 VapC toxin family PIN domain ribonuclease [Desulfonatronum sp. SC1]
MRCILIDTNAYAAFKRGHPEAVEVIRRAEAIRVSVIILAELLAGFHFGNREKDNRVELNNFLKSPRVACVPVDTETTEHYARIYRQLREDGKPIPTNDLWIAATAMRHGWPVFTLDRHFAFIRNLLLCRSPADMLP